jgi:hypothetical protein
MTGRKEAGQSPASPAANDDAVAAGPVSWLYVISNAANPDGPVKIGLSNAPERRLSQFQCASPVLLKIRHAAEVPATDVLRLEQAVHRQLGRYRIRGEWFDLTVADAILEVTMAIITHANDEPPRWARSGGARDRRKARLSGF